MLLLGFHRRPQKMHFRHQPDWSDMPSTVHESLSLFPDELRSKEGHGINWRCGVLPPKAATKAAPEDASTAASPSLMGHLQSKAAIMTVDLATDSEELFGAANVRQLNAGSKDKQGYVDLIEHAEGDGSLRDASPVLGLMANSAPNSPAIDKLRHSAPHRGPRRTRSQALLAPRRMSSGFLGIDGSTSALRYKVDGYSAACDAIGCIEQGTVPCVVISVCGHSSIFGACKATQAMHLHWISGHHL